MKIIAPDKKLITRRGLLRAASIAAPAILSDRAFAQFNGCLPGFCGAIGPIDPFFSNVILMNNFQGANNSVTIPDQGPLLRGNGTIFGNAKLTTAQAQFGVSSLLVPASSSAIGWGPSASYAIGTSWTIELGVRFNTTGAQTVGSMWAGGGGGPGWQVSTGTSQEVTFFYTDGIGGFPINFTSVGSQFVVNTWYQ